ncbi:unnamed protein product [Acanthoscelides obtectus]|nr:unnamed protein product [Acanthoscelides obtectus]CAK1657658.1 hypothetical protein AOBTE_LOCUS20465 [Acanthoscelides obtectus]
MEYYDWSKNASKKSVEALFGKQTEDIPNVKEYSEAVSTLMNEGESEYSVTKYGDSVRKLLGLPDAPKT